MGSKNGDFVMPTQTLKFLLLVFFLGVANISCTGTDADKSLKIRQPGEGKGDSGNSNKPEDAAMKAALREKVLFVISPSTQLKKVTEDEVILFADFQVNKKLGVSWRRTLQLKIDQQSKVLNFESDGLKRQNLSLTAIAKRIKNTESTKEEDPGYLAIAYELQLDFDDQGETKRSYQLVIFDLNLLNSNKAIIKSEFLFPAPDDFNLNEWVEKNLKQP